MMHITATLTRKTPADAEPAAVVRGVYDSKDLARMHASPQRGDVVLPVTWSRSSRRPRVGEMLATTNEGSGLVAVVLPR
jgi:hypothetical protein